MSGYLAYGLGYFDGHLCAARTFAPSPSIAHAVAAYIAAFGEVPDSVTCDGEVVWSGRHRHQVQIGIAKRQASVFRHTKQ